MANAIPLLEGTNTSGGYLVPDIIGQTLVNTLLREGSVADLARKERIAGKREVYPVYAGRPTASFVAEGAAKPVTGAEYAQITLNVKKIATTVIYTEELLEDAREDPRILVNADVEGAFADLIDAHALGVQGGASIATQFDSKLAGTGGSTTTQEVALTGSGLALAISAAMAQIELQGGKPNGIILSSSGRGHLRDARAAVETTNPVYSPGFDREPDTLYGLPIRYASNLTPFTTAAAAGNVIGVVGDFTHAVLGIRKDIVVRFSNQATLDVSGTLHHLFQQNKVAALWEMRIGFVVHDLNRMFVQLVNAV